MNNRFLKICVALTLWFFFSFLAVLAYAWYWLNEKREILDQQTPYVIQKGASLYSVSQDLHDQGVLRWPRVLIIYAKLSNTTSIKAGEYVLGINESPKSLLQKFHSGKVIQYQISLIEGTRFVDFLNKIHAQEKIVKTVDNNTALAAFKSEGITIDYVEGWFYPDTYSYVAGDTDLSLLSRAYRRMRDILSEEWTRREGNLPYKNPYEALIMASIVEKETGVAYERGQIAGVFVRRLRRGMRLQTDPTVIYGMGESYDGNIRRKDLRTPSPYNTYLIKGLPPTPIAMPGREAIHAALNPEPGTSLYFVAKGDGTHFFSETVEQHNQAVMKYQKNRREDYRSAPSNKSVRSVKGEG